MRRFIISLILVLTFSLSCGDITPSGQGYNNEVPPPETEAEPKEKKKDVETSKQYQLKSYRDEDGNIHLVEETAVIFTLGGDVRMLSKKDPVPSNYNTLKRISEGTMREKGDELIVEYTVAYEPDSPFSFLEFEPIQIHYVIRDSSLISISIDRYTYFTDKVKSNEL